MNNRVAIRALTAWASCLLLAGLTACAEEVTGPSPVVADHGAADEDSLPIAPPIVCRDQLTTEVTITGDGFSPVPIDVPHAPRIAIPTVTLERGHELDGAPGDGAAVVFSGDPDVPTNLRLLTWQSQEQLTLTVTQTACVVLA